MDIAEQYSAPIPLLGRLRRSPWLARTAPAGPPPRRASPLAVAPDAGKRAGPAPVPQSARIRMAFREVPPTAVEARVLVALADNPGETSERLSRVCGWHGKIWHTHLAAICHKRMKWLFDDADTAAEGQHFLYGVLAEYDPTSASFAMRPEAEIALAGLGIIASLR